jgi:hypothetical protein
MRRLPLGRRLEGILAWDSYFHLAHEARRAMFAAFGAHAGGDTVLMFNTGPAHGEGTSTFTFKHEPLYHASLAPAKYRALLDRSGFEVICQSRTTRKAVVERFAQATALRLTWQGSKQAALMSGWGYEEPCRRQVWRASNSPGSRRANAQQRTHLLCRLLT